MDLGLWLADPNFRWVLAGSVLLGVSGGALGTFALLRRRSLIGDVLSHAALPGIGLAFMATQSKAIGPLLIGAAISSLLGAAAVNGITRYSRIKPDTALGLVLTVFFGFGILLLTKIAQSGAASQAGLDTFLFGQAASLVADDVKVMAGVAGVLAVALITFFHEFKLLSFDAGYAKGIGRPVLLMDYLLMVLIVGAVVIGLQAVGVVLMAALLITPAAAARYWTDRLSTMVILAALFGAVSGVLGTVVSTAGFKLATGPLIVLAATAVFFFSLLFAPERGLVGKALRHLAVRRRVEREHVLRALFELQEVAARERAARGAVGRVAKGVAGPGAVVADTHHDPGEIARHRSDVGRRLPRVLRRLEREGLVERAAGDPGESPQGLGYRLTEGGLREAYRVVRNHRLWEMFLMHEAEFAVEQVDRDADVLEHELPPEVVTQLEHLLRLHGREPMLPPSVHPLTGERGADGPSGEDGPQGSAAAAPARGSRPGAGARGGS